MKREHEQVEFRYYEIPPGQYILALLGPGWEREYGFDTHGTTHFHNHLEIGYCYRGSGRLLIGGKEHRYGAGSFTVIPENIRHTTESDPGHIDKWEFLFVDINSFVENELRDLRIPPQEILRIICGYGTMKTMTHHSRMGSLVRLMLEECRTAGPHHAEAVKGYLRAFVVEALRLAEEREMTHSASRYDRYIGKAVRYIEEHFRENLKIEDLAAICGLSESHFRRIFEDVTNMRPVEYLNLVRIDKACQLILREEIPMMDAGMRVGYQTVTSFNRNFKRVTGYTPLKWKQHALSEEGMILRERRISARMGWQAEPFPEMLSGEDESARDKTGSP